MPVTRLQIKKEQDRLLKERQESATKTQRGHKEQEHTDEGGQQQRPGQRLRSEDTLIITDSSEMEDGTPRIQRYTTPVAHSPLRSPPPLQRQERVGNPGIFNIGETRRCYMDRKDAERTALYTKHDVRDLAGKFKRFVEQSQNLISTDSVAPLHTQGMPLLGSPYAGPSPKRRLGPEGTELWDSTASLATPTPTVGSHDFVTERRDPLNSGFQRPQILGRQALGPHGTILIDEHGHPVLSPD